MKLNELLLTEEFISGSNTFGGRLSWRKQLGKKNQFLILIEGGQYGVPATDEAWVMSLHMGGYQGGLYRWSYANYTDIETVYRHAVGFVETIEQYEARLPVNPTARAEKARFTFKAGLLTSMLHDYAVVIEDAISNNDDPAIRSFKHGLERVMNNSHLVTLGDHYLGEDMILFCKDKRVADEIFKHAQTFKLNAYIVDGRPQ